MRDLREALRALRSTPVLTAAAVLSLALGLGANTALFSLVNSLLLRPLPIRDPGGLVAIGAEVPGQDAELMHPVWLALRDRHLLDGAFAWAKDGLSEVQAGETRPVNVVWASPAFFDTLGVGAQIGRTLGRGDSAAAVISDTFWKRRFAQSPDVLGRAIVLDRVPFTIVGVAAAPFAGLEVGTTFDVVLPLDSEPLLQRTPSRLALWPWLHVAGRLAPEQTLASAAAALRSAQPAIRDATMPFENADDRDAYLKDPLTLRPAGNGTSRLRDRYGNALMILIAIAALVLLVGCANIANLQMARAGARHHERSVRAALGASRWQLLRPVFLESLLLAAAGTAIALAAASPAGALLVRQLSTWTAAPVLDLSLDARVFGAGAALLIATLALFGVAPAAFAGRAEPLATLRRAPSRMTGTAGRWGEILVGAQVAVCIVLLVGAGLFIRSFAALIARDLGFDRRPVLVAAVDAQRSSVPPASRLALFDRMQERASALPGVEAAALSMATPLGNAGVRFMPRVSLNAAEVAAKTAPRLLTNAISPGWFRAYGTRLLAGRDFTPADGAGAPPVAIVNAAFARRFLAGASPLGRAFATTTPGAASASPLIPHIVGVVEDAAFTSARTAVEPTVYRPLAQTATPELLTTMATICVSVRAREGLSPEALRPTVASALSTLDGQASIATVTVNAQLDANYVRERLLGLLAGFFALLGLLLAAVGLYGVTAHAVNGRRRELAIRIALGAERRRIMRLVFRRLALVAGCGIVMGTLAAITAGRVVEGLLFGITARDPLAFTLAFTTLLVTVIAAAWGPARRAARTEPIVALRDQ